MRFFLKEKLYRYILEVDPQGYTAMHDALFPDENTNYIFSDLNHYFFPADDWGKELKKNSVNAYLDYIVNIQLPPDLDILRDIVVIDDDRKSQEISTEQFVENTRLKINSLPENIDKTICQLYLLKYELEKLTQNNVFDSDIVVNFKKNIIDTYNSSPKTGLDEDMLSSIHYLITEVFVIEYLNSDLSKTVDGIKNLYNTLMSRLSSVEETMNNMFPTEYSMNLKNYERIYSHKTFYSKFIAPLLGDNFLELDLWFNEIFNSVSNNFKYGDFNYFKLEYMEYRLLSYFGNSQFDKGFELINELYTLISNNLQDRDLMGRALTYRATFYTGRFFVLFDYIRNFEKEILNDLTQYKNKNQFNNITMLETEEVGIRYALRIYKERPNWSVIERKFKG